MYLLIEWVDKITALPCTGGGGVGEGAGFWIGEGLEGF